MMWPQVRVTGRLQQLLPSFLPAVLGYGVTAPLEKVVVDDARHTLYTLSPPGHIQVLHNMVVCRVDQTF
jgi:nuclear pore complex protein Nup155